MNKEFYKMQKLAGLITEGQYKGKVNESTLKIGDKVKHDGEDYYVIQTAADNDLDIEYPLFKKALTDNGATKDDFIIISKIEPEYGENFSTKLIINLLNSKLIKIIKSTENVNEIEGDDYYGYNEPMSQKDINKAYAEDTSDPYVNDKIAYIVDALQHVWNMGKGNNKINFDDMAEGIIDDLATRF